MKKNNFVAQIPPSPKILYKRTQVFMLKIKKLNQSNI